MPLQTYQTHKIAIEIALVRHPMLSLFDGN